MKISKLAWRNIWRRKRRTLITAFSIAFGVMLAVTFTGMGDYSYGNMINSSAHMGLGHVSVSQRGYNQSPALDKKVALEELQLKQIGALEQVDSIYQRIIGQAMFASANKTVGGAFLAINPRQENREYNLLIRSIVEGELFSNGRQKQIVVGKRLAEKLNLRIGKKLVYTTTDSSGEIVSDIARVSALFETGVKEVDGHMALLPINTVRAVLNYQENEASFAALVIKDQRRAEKVQAQVKKIVANNEMEVLTWRQTQPDVAGFVALDRSTNYVSQVLIGMLIGAGILNTLLMSVMERSREFGVLMAIGMSPTTLFRLVIVESLWLALIGLILGIVITAPWFYYLAQVGIDFSGAFGDDFSAGGVLIDPVMKIKLFKESAIGILVVVFSLTIVSGLYPAWRAGRIPPVESLKVM